ncbi:protein of unknown function [Vibrio tapetis subsp. tapetis]|uniref:Uncharacterized protein n=1 Tax=Vibrio tapetis subsp. tapetis TaxID=1671868 RepID=A0A2N8ZLX2_9VIBR|nr:protein of unknown function [Vibrio tapetis subsp. tapetis]
MYFTLYKQLKTAGPVRGVIHCIDLGETLVTSNAEPIAKR